MNRFWRAIHSHRYRYEGSTVDDPHTGLLSSCDYNLRGQRNAKSAMVPKASRISLDGLGTAVRMAVNPSDTFSGATP